MDNNFDENNSVGSEGLDSGNSPLPQQSQPSRQQAPQLGQIPPLPQYAGYDPNLQGQNIYPQPAQDAHKPIKNVISKGCFWLFVGIITLLFIIVVILSVKISMNEVPETENSGTYSDLTDTQKADNHIVMELPTVKKPILEEECYQNKETGLLTTVGVAKTILPSQVQIKVFGEVPYAPVSSGSGIILTEDGYILTNAHVVDGAVRLSVGFYDGTESEAVTVGMDKKSDLAVVKVDRNDLSPAQIGTSSDLVIGEEVALAGAGGGFENTVTYGHVTGLGREIDTDYISSSTILCIQSDAALNPGNSGGALVNMYGQVVGVAVALMNHETYENIGFSIAIDDAVPIAEDLIAQGYVSSRTRVGITYVSIGDAAASQYGIPAGLCVMDVDPSCSIAGVGLKPYDIITEIDGYRVFGAEEVSEALADKLPGDTITISVFRKEVTGEINYFSAQTELAPDVSSISGYSANSTDEDFFGRDIIK